VRIGLRVSAAGTSTVHLAPSTQHSRIRDSCIRVHLLLSLVATNSPRFAVYIPDRTMADEPKSQELNAQLDAVAGKADELATALLQLLAKPAPPQTLRQKFAPDRATRDIQAANDSARAATQAALLINGGAATAILAYLSKDAHTPVGLLSAASLSLMGYALGVFFGAVSVWCSSQASAQFGYFWEATADGDAAGQAIFTKKGKAWLIGHWLSFGLSILFFIVSSFWIACAFLRAIPAQ
jgi:hypothetical protein